jgi:hypothetical protein
LRTGTLTSFVADDPGSSIYVGAFLQEMQEPGWTLSRKMRIDTRWGGSADADGVRRYFTELVALAPPWEDLHELHEPT